MNPAAACSRFGGEPQCFRPVRTLSDSAYGRSALRGSESAVASAPSGPILLGMGSIVPPAASLPLPPVDERLVMPETRHEIVDGRVTYVSPADELHGSRHSKLSALLEAYVLDEYDAASDMLTRTSKIDDVAPDGSVFPQARDPETGQRQIEQLAFEVVSTERLGHTESKARKLVGRGVRRVFAIDLDRQRVMEWSTELEGWQMLSPTGAIEDRVFIIPLPIQAVVQAAKADDAVAEALIAKGNRVIKGRVTHSRAEGRAEGEVQGTAHAILKVLEARGLA